MFRLMASLTALWIASAVALVAPPMAAPITASPPVCAPVLAAHCSWHALTICLRTGLGMSSRSMRMRSTTSEVVPGVLAIMVPNAFAISRSLLALASSRRSVSVWKAVVRACGLTKGAKTSLRASSSSAMRAMVLVLTPLHCVNSAPQ